MRSLLRYQYIMAITYFKYVIIIFIIYDIYSDTIILLIGTYICMIPIIKFSDVAMTKMIRDYDLVGP